MLAYVVVCHTNVSLFPFCPHMTPDPPPPLHGALLFSGAFLDFPVLEFLTDSASGVRLLPSACTDRLPVDTCPFGSHPCLHMLHWWCRMTVVVVLHSGPDVGLRSFYVVLCHYFFLF